MKHPDCPICKSEIKGNAYSFNKSFFCFEHYMKEGRVSPIKNPFMEEIIRKGKSEKKDDGDIIL